MASASPPSLLSDAAAFGAPVGTSIELIQTHIGYVYLVGDFAYKLKKPVRFDFLDFSTLEKRRWALDRELTLNRRLCPDLYLGLLAVVERPDAARAVVEDPAGAFVVDWALKMKRMPSDRLFDRLLDAGAVSAADVEAIARVLTPFYAAQRGTIPPGGLGDFDATQFNIDENLREGRALDETILPRAQLDLIEARTRRFLTRHGDEIRSRARRGFIVDGHGDLRAENICLPLDGPPLLFDCIEFNDRFRICDSAQDIAFLAMELEARGRSDLATHFVTCYRAGCDTGLSDRLLNFHLGYRSFVKGKVEAWIAGDSGIPFAQRIHAIEKARHNFDLSLSYSMRNKPLLLVFCGVSGSGKSTLARETAKRLRANHLSTDLIRDEILPRGTPAEQRYTPQASARVYQEMLIRAKASLRSGECVLLDGTHTSRANRGHALALARETNTPALLVWADCSPEAARKHMEARSERGLAHGSEATESISLAQRQHFERPVESEGFAAILYVNTDAGNAAVFNRFWTDLCVTLQKVLNS